MLETYKVLGAMLALKRFKTADLAVFAGVSASTARTVVNRHEQYLARVGRLDTGRRGGQPVIYELRDEWRDELAAKVDEARQSTTIDQRIPSRIPSSPGASDSEPPLLGLVVAVDLMLSLSSDNRERTDRLVRRAELALKSARDEAHATRSMLSDRHSSELQDAFRGCEALIELSKIEYDSSKSDAVDWERVRRFTEQGQQLNALISTTNKYGKGDEIRERVLASPVVSQVFSHPLPGLVVSDDSDTGSALGRRVTGVLESEGVDVFECNLPDFADLMRSTSLVRDCIADIATTPVGRMVGGLLGHLGGGASPMPPWYGDLFGEVLDEPTLIIATNSGDIDELAHDVGLFVDDVKNDAAQVVFIDNDFHQRLSSEIWSRQARYVSVAGLDDTAFKNALMATVKPQVGGVFRQSGGARQDRLIATSDDDAVRNSYRRSIELFGQSSITDE